MYQGSAELQRSLVVTSPRKYLTKKYSWCEAEDRATVQFIAMHKAEQATDNEWPAMRLEFGSKIY